MTPERVDDRVDRLPVDLQRVELAAGDASTGVLRPSPSVTRRRKSCRGPLARPVASRVEDAVRARGQGARDPADPPVGGEGQRAAVPALEELGQGVLQERKRARLMGHVGDHLGDEPGLGRDADRFGRPRMACSSSSGVSGGTASVRAGEQLAEARIHQRPIVEVRPEGDDHAQPAPGSTGGHAQRLEEQLPLGSSSTSVKTSSNWSTTEHDLRLRRAGPGVDRREQAS